MKCAVCGAGSPRSKLRKGDVQIFECPHCALAWWVPEPDFEPAAVYDAAYFADATAAHGYDDYGEQEASLRATFRRRLARIPRPAGRARLLDVGAAYGFGVDEARRAGWDAAGLEVSRAAAARAGAVAGGRVAVADALRAPFGAATFDAVTLWDVIEHLPDPHDAIGEASRLLRPGGRLVLTTGDVGSAVARLSGARWHLYTLPEHLFFYSRRSLGLLVRAHGFRVERLYADSGVYTLGYLVERLRKTLFGKPATHAASWPGAGMRVPVNLFDVVTAQAVRDGGA